MKLKKGVDMLEKIKDFQIAILGLFFALGIIIGTIIVTDNLSKDNISVTGSAYEVVSSDSASWSFNIEVKSPTKLNAYKAIKSQFPIVEQYLLANGITKEQIDAKAPTSYEVNKKNPANGYTTDDIAYYVFSQNVKIQSNDVEKIKNISSKSQELIEKGVNITSYEQPEYQYSKLADLKVKLLETATLDAKNRAKSMLKSNNNNVGKIRSARMGVFQITPVNSNSVSDMGINDLSTIEKKVTAVANIVFAIK